MEERVALLVSDELERRFEGAATLQRLLAASGTLADVDDVADAFKKAAAAGVPPSVVITALWEDEPTFASPDEARQLFSNLLGLFELLAAGENVDLKLGAPQRLAKRAKAPKPEPLGGEAPTERFIEAAWRYLDDHPKERERLSHAFENRLDNLLQWLELEDLPDDAFGLARQLLFDLFAFSELAGRPVLSVALPTGTSSQTLNPALATWVDEAVTEASTDDEAPLPEAQAERVRALATQGGVALWPAD